MNKIKTTGIIIFQFGGFFVSLEIAQKLERNEVQFHDLTLILDFYNLWNYKTTILLI